jgi:hypothetical protein
MRAKKYIAALIQVFLLAGTLGGVLWGLRAGFLSGVYFGLLFAVGLTALVSLIILPLDFALTRRESAHRLCVNQHDEVVLPGTVEQVLAQVTDVIARLAIVKRIQAVPGESTIVAWTRPSLWSFGEEVKLAFTQHGAADVLVRVSSQPILWYTTIDYGKNYRNVKVVRDELVRSLGESART